MFETKRFWWARLNLCDDQKSSLNILIITNWKKLKMRIKETNSITDALL